MGAEILTQFLFSMWYYFLAAAIAVYLLRWTSTRRCWCACPVCTAYLTSSWTEEFENLADWYTHLLRQSPTRTIHIHVLGKTITANPENVKHMLLGRFPNYPKGKAFSSILGDLLGRGIFNVDGDEWRFQRKMASLELGSVSVRSFAFSIVSSEVRTRLLPILQSTAATCSVVDIQDVFRRFSFDTICKFSFGIDPGCLELSMPMSDFAAAFDCASRLSAQRATLASSWSWRTKRLLNCGSERQLRKAVRLVNELAEEVIRQRRKTGISTRNDLLSRFMGSVDDSRYLRDIVVSFLLAGRDTVASGLTSFFFLLSNHPEVESKLLREIEREMGDADELVCYDNLRKMHYTHAAIYESMRLFPPVQFDSKFALHDDLLPDGTRVKKNTRVTYHQYAMGRMDDVWGSDCMEFKPERWLQDSVFVPADPFKYPVFQAGLRVCLGKEMALMEMKNVIASVVKHFRLDITSENRDSLIFSPGLTSTVSGGLRARVVSRVRALS